MNSGKNSVTVPNTPAPKGNKQSSGETKDKRNKQSVTSTKIKV